MGLFCYICKRYNYQQSIRLSYHRFPKNNDIRKVWMAILGLSAEEHIPNLSYVCSKHFNENDFLVSSDGRKYLKPGATPVFSNFGFDELETTNSSSSSSFVTSSAAVCPDEASKKQEVKVSEEEEKSLQQENVLFNYSTLESSPIRNGSASSVSSLDSVHLDEETVKQENTISDEEKASVVQETIVNNCCALDSSPVRKRSTSSLSSLASVHLDEEAKQEITIFEEGEALLDQENLSLYLITLESSPVENRFMLAEPFIETAGPSDYSKDINNVSNDNLELVANSSSGTLTASENEDEAKELQSFTKPTIKRKRKKTIRYIGDLSWEDFSTPENAKKNFNLMKNTLDHQRKKIKSLRTTVAYLRGRVRALKGTQLDNKKKLQRT